MRAKRIKRSLRPSTCGLLHVYGHILRPWWARRDSTGASVILRRHVLAARVACVIDTIVPVVPLRTSTPASSRCASALTMLVPRLDFLCPRRPACASGTPIPLSEIESFQLSPAAKTDCSKLNRLPSGSHYQNAEALIRCCAEIETGSCRPHSPRDRSPLSGKLSQYITDGLQAHKPQAVGSRPYGFDCARGRRRRGVRRSDT